MARDKLSAVFVAKTKEIGRHSDGGGLYLWVRPGASGVRKSWIFRYHLHGKRREIGLGSAADVTLAKAREAAANAREAVAAGKEPLSKPSARVTFGDVADQLVADLSPGWRNSKHAAQWRMTLTVYAADLRAMPVSDVDTAAVLKVLTPLWQEKPETASRLRARIERVLDAAKARGMRDGENPARWGNHLKLMLPKPRKLTRGHHAAMPVDEVPGFVRRLREVGSLSALALEFIILTAARSGEVLRSVRHGEVQGMRWAEVDLDARVWTVPAARMKSNRVHQVPLSTRAAEILIGLPRISPWVFPSVYKTGSPLSEMACEALMRDMEAKPATVHGFRSCFRDWAGDRTSFPRELVEHALSHRVGSAVELAYRRSDALERRRPLMEAWSSYCSASSNVVAMRR